MDLISRQAAIEALRAMQTYKLVEGDDLLLIDQAEAQTKLMMLPSAEPKIKCIAKVTLSDEQVKEVIEKVKNAKCEILAAQPEREKGKWVYGEDEYGVDGYRCDKCGFFVLWDYGHNFINYIGNYNFCPWCGADMRGEIGC